MGINVDYYQEIVFITSPTTNVTVQEVYDAMRAAEDTPEGTAFGGPVKSITDGFVDGEGEADVGAGFTNPLTITLDSNWYIEFWNGVSLGIVADGNIAGGAGSRPVRCAVGSADTALVLGAERGIVAGGAVTQTDIDDIVDAVWDEVTADHTDDGSYGHELATKSDIASSSSTSETIADSGTAVAGGVGAGTYVSTAIRDNTYWQIDENGSTGITVELVFELPNDEKAGAFKVFGRYEGQPSLTHYIELWAYNYESAAWEQLLDNFMPGGFTSDAEYVHEFFERNIDRTNNNEAKFRLIHNVTTYNTAHDLYLDFVVATSIEVITAGDIADAVWDEAMSGHTVLGTFGAYVQKLPGIGKMIALIKGL